MIHTKIMGVIFILYLHIPVQYHTLNDKMYWDELYKQQVSCKSNFYFAEVNSTLQG